MEKNKKVFLILVMVLIISAITVAYAKEYYIPEAFVNLTVEDNGLLHVDEEYDYHFIGTYNGVSRNIPLKSGEHIENLRIHTTGAYAEYSKTVEDGELKLKIYLYTDESKTQRVSDTNVNVYISYDMENVVTIYNDTASLQYKIWGSEWEIPVSKLTTNVYLPGDTGNMYWLNPSQYNLTSTLTGNTITSVSTKIPSGEYYELQVLMPTDDFHDAQYAKHDSREAKNEIIKIQEDYKAKETFFNSLYLYLGSLFIISPLALVGIYFKYGREPEIGYNQVYERDIPTNDPPAKVNALIDGKGSQSPNMKGYEASIMDLINRKVIKLETEGEENKTLILDFTESDQYDLDGAERILIQTLRSFAVDNKLNLDTFKGQLYNDTNARYFKEHYDQWIRECSATYLSDANYKEYLDTKGAKLSKRLGILGIILGAILGFMTYISELPNATIGFIGSVIIVITSIVSFVLPAEILGHWSEYGKEYHDKWHNFKKFLKDNSLINEHPPESIIIWNQYLVYGTALGVADNVYKAMKLHVPSTSDWDDDLYMFHMYNGTYMMHSAFSTGISTANSDSDSGLGGVGGGSGGGGGGAF